MEHLLPPPDEAEWLLDSLARLVAARGPGPLVSCPIVEPTRQYFPDRWTATPGGVEILARRLLGYAGIDHLEPIVDSDAHLDEREEGDCGLQQADLPIWFAGLAEGSCLFGVRDGGLEDSETAAAALCHAVAHAYRAYHGLTDGDPSEGTYREPPARLVDAGALEERLTDLTTVYLGFGLLTANASLRQRSRGEVRGTMASWQVITTRVSALDPHSMSYLLAAQAIARGWSARDRKKLASQLDTNQAAFFAAACKAIGVDDVEALRARLGVPAPERWPAPPDLVELTRPHRPAASRAPLAKTTPESELPNRGQPVFRVIAHQGIPMLVLFVLVGGVTPLLFSISTSVFLLLDAAFGAAGYFIGKARRRDECSNRQCEGPLAAGVRECPKCGGKIVGEIARPEDRLAALEALEEERLALAQKKNAELESLSRAPRLGK